MGKISDRGERRHRTYKVKFAWPDRFQKAASFLDYTVGTRFNNYAKQPSFYSRPGASSRNAVIIPSGEQKTQRRRIMHFRHKTVIIPLRGGFSMRATGMRASGGLRYACYSSLNASVGLGCRSLRSSRNKVSKSSLNPS